MHLDAQTSEQFVNALVDDCCRELFAAYGLLLGKCRHELPPQSASPLSWATLSFHASAGTGELVFAASEEVLRESGPLALDSASACDWLCELANQLLGRVKSRLLLRGVELVLATPKGRCGEYNSVTLAPDPRAQTFAVGGGYFCAWIRCTFHEGLDLGISRARASGVPAEGELLLF